MLGFYHHIGTILGLNILTKNHKLTFVSWKCFQRAYLSSQSSKKSVGLFHIIWWWLMLYVCNKGGFSCGASFARLAMIWLTYRYSTGALCTQHIKDMIDMTIACIQYREVANRFSPLIAKSCTVMTIHAAAAAVNPQGTSNTMQQIKENTAFKFITLSPCCLIAFKMKSWNFSLCCLINFLSSLLDLPIVSRT